MHLACYSSECFYMCLHHIKVLICLTVHSINVCVSLCAAAIS